MSFLPIPNEIKTVEPLNRTNFCMFKKISTYDKIKIEIKKTFKIHHNVPTQVRIK